MSKDGKFVAMMCGVPVATNLLIYSMTDKKDTVSIRVPPCYSITFSADGKKVAIGGKHGTLRKDGKDIPGAIIQVRRGAAVRTQPPVVGG